MNSQSVFCPNIDCPARGRCAQGNIHSRREKRSICTVCQQTFSVTKGSLFYRLRTDSVQGMLVITLLTYGCLVPAIVKVLSAAATTMNGWSRGGGNCHSGLMLH